MRGQLGFSVIEVLLVALAAGLIFAIIYKNYEDAVLAERRNIAKQGMVTVVGLQEKWFLRMYKYARSIEQVGGKDIAGDYFEFKITQDPCGDDSCFTVTAKAMGDQEKDIQCDVLTINNMGKRTARSRANQDTTKECWKA